MASTYLWHQLHLYRFKALILLGFLSVGIVFTGRSQQISIRKNLLNHDIKPMHYGFYLGVNASRYQLEHSDLYVQRIKDSLLVNSRYAPGFTIGFVLNKRLSEFADLRFVPGVGFYSRSIEYKSEKGDVLQQLGSTALEFPLLVKAKSLRRGNIRMYFVGGAKAAVDIGNKRKADDSQELEVKSSDFAIEYGVGLDLFYPYFKFSPELRFSNGLSNRHRPGEGPYSQSVQRAVSNTVTLYLNFEN